MTHYVLNEESRAQIGRCGWINYPISQEVILHNCGYGGEASFTDVAHMYIQLRQLGWVDLDSQLFSGQATVEP